MAENENIDQILQRLKADLQYFDQTLANIRSAVTRAKQAIVRIDTELNAHAPPYNTKDFKQEALGQLTLVSNVFCPSEILLRMVGAFRVEVRKVRKKRARVGVDEQDVRNLLDDSFVCDEADYLRRTIDGVKAKSKQFMWCSFENAMPPPPVPIQRVGRCFPYNVLRTHEVKDLLLVEDPDFHPPAGGANVHHVPDPDFDPDFEAILAIPSNQNQTLIAVLGQRADDGERKIKIYTTNNGDLGVTSVLIPRNFQPVHMCFGYNALRDLLFVADEVIPRVIVFKIASDGEVWQYICTFSINLQTISTVKLDADNHLLISTSDGHGFRSEESIAELGLTEQPNQGLPPGNYKCGKHGCKTCKEIEDGARSFRSTATGNSFPINDRLTCDSKNVIYLISCTTHAAQYVGKGALRVQMNRHRSSQTSPVYKHFNNVNYIYINPAHDKKMNIITYCGDTTSMDIIEAMWINRLKTFSQRKLNRTDGPRPEDIHGRHDYNTLQEKVSGNYHVMAGALDDQNEMYFPEN